MKEQRFYLEDLHKLIQLKDNHALFRFMEENVACFFSSADISGAYKIMRDVDVNDSKSVMPKLIKGWLAFLCGDNITLANIMRAISESNLESEHEYSMLYSLKAISGWNSNLKEREQYASLAVDILHKEDSSFYMANALLTFGQMLSNQDKYRSSAEIFAKAYDLFDFNNMQFPAVISRVNELLNRYKLGEFRSVIDICQNLLLMSAQFNSEEVNEWDMLHLPLGICYYELNKPHLAIKHLLAAKANIERLNLFHMHGLVEVFLYKAYFTLQDQTSMRSLYKEAVKTYEAMYDPMGKVILNMFYLLLESEQNNTDTLYNIQQLEMTYETLHEDTPTLAILFLIYLKSRGLSTIITRKEINKYLEKLRYIGLIPDLQLLLVLNANLLQYEGNDGFAISNLQEALNIHKEFGISAAFNFASSPILSHMRILDEKLWLSIHKEKGIEVSTEASRLLSNREREIMILISKGRSNQEVGDLLFISVGTVKWHINHIFSKFQVNNRVQAIEKAKVLGEI